MRRVLISAGVLLLAGCGTGAPGPAAAPGHTGTAPTTAGSAAPRLRIGQRARRLPGPIAREAVIPVSAGTIVAGGLLAGDASSAATYLLRTDGTARRMPPLPVPVHDTAGAMLGGHPLVIGGGNASEQDVVQEWRRGRWSVVGHLPQPRSDLVTATVGGRVLVLGGYDGTRPAEPTILASTDGRRWQVVGRLPVPVRYPAATVAGGSVWLFGGEAGGAMQRAIQRVDPATGRAQVVGRLPRAIGHSVAIPLGGRILLMGGRTGTDTLTNRMWWFDPASGSVRPAGALPGKLSDAAVARVGASYEVIGGEIPGDTTRVLSVSYR